MQTLSTGRTAGKKVTQDSILRGATLTRAQMHIRHYKVRKSQDDLHLAGCGCRGCQLAYWAIVDRRADELIAAEDAAKARKARKKLAARVTAAELSVEGAA